MLQGVKAELVKVQLPRDKRVRADTPSAYKKYLKGCPAPDSETGAYCEEQK